MVKTSDFTTLVYGDGTGEDIPRISFSGWKKDKECGLLYHLDVNKTAPENPDNQVGTLFGKAIGLLGERFYEQEIWRSKNPEADLYLMAPGAVNEAVEETLAKPMVEFFWLGHPKSTKHNQYTCIGDIVEDVRKHIPNLLRIIRHHRLLAPVVKTELRLSTIWNIEGKKAQLDGRLDFLLMGDKHILLDGKGTKHGNTKQAKKYNYTPREQLLWYSVLLEEQTGRAPDQMGFVYWRLPPGEALVLEDVRPDELTSFRKVMYDAMADILARQEAPQPNTGNHCKLCKFATPARCTSGYEEVQKLDRIRNGSHKSSTHTGEELFEFQLD